MRNLIAVLLCSLLALPSAAQDVPKPTIQEQVVEIGQGVVVEVRLKKPKEKLRGRMGEVASGAFTLQIAKGSQLTDRTIAFGDVKSIKTVTKTTSTTTHVFATLGVIWLVSTIIAIIVYKGKLD